MQQALDQQHQASKTQQVDAVNEMDALAQIGRHHQVDQNDHHDGDGEAADQDHILRREAGKSRGLPQCQAGRATRGGADAHIVFAGPRCNFQHKNTVAVADLAPGPGPIVSLLSDTPAISSGLEQIHFIERRPPDFQPPGRRHFRQSINTETQPDGACHVTQTVIALDVLEFSVAG